jgi:hypothetical protein
MSIVYKESGLTLAELTDLFIDFKNSKGTGSFVFPTTYQDAYSDYLFSITTTVNGSSTPTMYKVLYIKESGAVCEQTFSVKITTNGVCVTSGKEKQLLKDAYLNESQTGTPAFYKLEKQYDLDIDGDGFVGTSVLLVDKANQSLLEKDATQLDGNSFYEMLSIDVKGKGASLTIDTSTALDEGSRRLVIGSRNTDWLDDATQTTDALLTNFKLLGSGMSVGFGTSSTGAMTIQNSNIDLAGSLLSTYIINLLQMDVDSDIGEQTLGVTLVGFGSRASGTLTIRDSEINYVRANDIGTEYGASADQIVLENNHGSLMGLFIAGSTGAKGVVSITGSDINMRGLSNTFTMGETGGQASATISNSTLNLDASYSTSDPRFDDIGEKDLGNNSIQVGQGDGTKTPLVSSLVVNNSDISLLGTQSYVNVGWNWGAGSVSITNSSLFIDGHRDADAINNGRIDAATYQYAWSGSYFNIGGEWGDGNSTTNESSNGIVKLIDTHCSMYGSHAGISVGVASSKAVGQLVLSNSVVSVLAGGAIYSPNGGSDYGWMESWWSNDAQESSNYLSGGMNSSGQWNSNYFAYVNIGGNNWSDAGGNGEVNLVGSRMQVFQMDFDSFDESAVDPSIVAHNIDSIYVDSSAANLSLGSGGNRAVLTMDDTSTLDVGGTINLANNVESLASAKYFLSNNGGVINTTSFIAGNGDNLSSFNRSTTYLNGDAEINAEFVNFENQSRLVGDGTIRAKDMFSGSIDIYSSDKETPDVYFDLGGDNNSFSILFDNAQILIGDVLTITKKAPVANKPLTGLSTEVITSGTGTLFFEVEEADEFDYSYLNFSNTNFYFDLGASAKDLISIGDFDYVNFSNCTFNIKMDKSLSGGADIQLVAFDDGIVYEQDINVSNITLLGVPGSTLVVNDGGIYLNV